MSAETLLYAALSGNAGVSSLVGARIYPEFVPQEQDPPFVAYTRTGTEYITTIHSGVPLAQISTIEIACMARTKASADAVADAVVLAVGADQFVLSGRASMTPDSELNGLHGTVLTVTRLTQ